MQARAVTPATNIKDDSNSVTAHNSRNASKFSRNESNNRTANTVGAEAKKRML